MKKSTVKISDLGMIALPKKVCRALKLSERSLVYICAEGDKVVLRNSGNLHSVTAQTLDELNRIFLHRAVRKYLQIDYGDNICLEIINDAVIVTKCEIT